MLLQPSSKPGLGIPSSAPSNLPWESRNRPRREFVCIPVRGDQVIPRRSLRLLQDIKVGREPQRCSPPGGKMGSKGSL